MRAMPGPCERGFLLGESAGLAPAGTTVLLVRSVRLHREVTALLLLSQCAYAGVVAGPSSRAPSREAWRNPKGQVVRHGFH